MDSSTLPLLTADVADVMYVHDLSLDGDELLALGQRVLVTDGVLTVPALVTYRNATEGYWYLQRALDPS